MDNFEWAKGYQQHFGIVWVNFDAQKNILKDSTRLYKHVIKENGFSQKKWYSDPRDKEMRDWNSGICGKKRRFGFKLGAEFHPRWFCRGVNSTGVLVFKGNKTMLSAETIKQIVGW